MCIIKYIVYIDYFSGAYTIELIVKTGIVSSTKVIMEKGFSGGSYSTGNIVEYTNLNILRPTFSSIQDCIKYLSLCGIL